MSNLQPRLTGCLRVYSGVTASNEPYTQQQLREELKCKKQLKQKLSNLSWSQVEDAINKSTDSKQGKEVAAKLIEVSLRFISDDCNIEAADEVAVLLLELFKDATQITSIESTKLRKTFGPYPASLASKAFDLVKTLVSLLPETFQVNDTSASVSKKKEYFDKSLKISFTYDDKDFDALYLLEESELEEDKKVDNLLNHVKDNISSHHDKLSTNFNQATTVNGVQETGTNNFSTSWLLDNCKDHVEKNPESVPPNDLATMLFEILNSSKSDDDIQTDLFDLLGFDAFDFIQKILENRSNITSVASQGISNGYNPSVYQNLNPMKKHDKPLPGSQVTIQTEQEKQLVKKMQKEERKLFKQNPDLYNEIFQQNNEQLNSLRNQPLFQRNVTSAAQLYPFVYDEFATRKLSSAYIAGTKILLPENVKKSDYRRYEEIDIPATSKKPPNMNDPPIKISELDEVGQIAFKGMKSLNLIQSVVFHTAYESNENLLISAPTGAGKTNIAMLTIVHEIKNNIRNGVLKKDAFKVVYVAPMKALAAEMTANFGRRLQGLGVLVRELTGDMQLTKKEIQETQMLVTTPEKWDVVTRKGSGDIALTQLVKLLIIDEVHLLHDDRGSVLEALVARTLRQVESSQSMIRIVGLSATLPNYVDVARFLNVNPYKGLFYFDGRFRPVPLQQTFIGIRATGFIQQMKDMDEVCYEKVLENVKNGHQVMVFVHARNATVKTALFLREKANNEGDIENFLCDQNAAYGNMLNRMNRSRNKQLREMFPDGFGIHHAGMLRQDRSLVEELFSKGFIKVLVCTATLAWGVNLPAHAVIIKGTQIYDAKKGSFVDIGILDVMQIFGRAGRPQFDKWGHGTIITKHDKLSHYLQLLTQQTPIESQFVHKLTDNLNAEVSLGSVTNVDEAVQWLSYTYLYVRMRINPLVYGINYKEKEEDPLLEKFRTELIKISARKLDKARMIRFDERTGYLFPTNLGRTASNFYIDFPTIELVNEFFKQFIDHGEIFTIVSKAHEFDQVKVRAEEMPELEQHMNEYCQTPVKGGTENEYGKVNILLQTYISRGNVESFSLVSDTAYVAQNAIRIIRALFEVAVQKNWAVMAHRMLTLSKIVDRRLWDWEHPFRQFDGVKHEVLNKLESRKLTIEKLREMDSKEIGLILNHVKIGSNIRSLAFQFPHLQLASSIQPITRNVLRVRLLIKADFKWNDKIHGTVSEPWWIWVESPDTNQIYHSEYFLLSKKAVKNHEEQELVFTIPIHEPLPPQYYVRAVSDRWLHAEAVCAISFKHLILPDHHAPHTELLDLQPIPITCLRNSQLQGLYNFSHFNPIQTQLFHTLYYSETNVLLGAPTGSGKTIAAEIAMFRVFREHPKSKVVYIAPLKALVRERITDWKVRLEQKLNKKVVELTGDVTPDMNAITNSDVIVTTPEKWDGVSRSWQTRKYVKDVALIVIDEIHLLGDDRGPVLEVIVSRTNFITSHTERKCRVIGLSTALANAKDLADWLGIGQDGLFNFRPSVRPVPLEVHVGGYPGKHYCPRMLSMNKPCFKGIKQHSPEKPVLIFVSSRRQTRLTAMDLVTYLAADFNPKQWLHMPEYEMDQLIENVRDENLKLTLSFGIGLHHAGLHEKDRKTVEELFVNQKIQVLIATSTLAWGVNFPAHLVIIKGTEYYDGKLRRFVDFPITDVLQMMGRAGRPQFDDNGVALVLVHDIKKQFYKKFLYEPFPVESNLLEVLPDHLNAEIVAGTITSKQDAMDYMTWTYFFRRLLMNPTYYGLEETDHNSITSFLSTLIQECIRDLEASCCIDVLEDDRTVEPTVSGRIASYYYLSHVTLRMFKERLNEDLDIESLLKVLCDSHEYSQLPVRHNEDQLNAELAEKVPIEVDRYTYDSPHTKTHLLLQAHFTRVPLPIADYGTDTKSVLDQAIRVMQAMIDYCADEGWLACVLQIIMLMQMVVQGRWYYDSPILQLPKLTEEMLSHFKLSSMRSDGDEFIEDLPTLMSKCVDGTSYLQRSLKKSLQKREIDQVYNVISRLPIMSYSSSVHGDWLKNDDDSNNSRETRTIALNMSDCERNKINWIQLHADQEYFLKINVSKKQLNKKRNDSRGYAPLFSKTKDEGWFFALGEVDTQDLLALKRVTLGRRDSIVVSLSFYTPEDLGRKIYTLYIMSDTYQGLDQQFDTHFDIVPPLMETADEEIADY